MDADTIAKAARAAGLDVQFDGNNTYGYRCMVFKGYEGGPGMVVGWFIFDPQNEPEDRCALHDGLRAKGYRIEYHNDTATGRPAVDIIHQDDAMGDRTLSTWEADNDIDALIEAAGKLEE